MFCLVGFWFYVAGICQFVLDFGSNNLRYKPNMHGWSFLYYEVCVFRKMVNTQEKLLCLCPLVLVLILFLYDDFLIHLF